MPIVWLQVIKVRFIHGDQAIKENLGVIMSGRMLIQQISPILKKYKILVFLLFRFQLEASIQP